MNLATWLAWRYLFAGRKRFAALITWTSVVGLALGVMVLTVVVSVMNGFERELRTRLLGAVPHLQLSAGADMPLPEGLLAPAKGEAPWPEIVRQLRMFDSQGMITQNGQVSPVAIHGFDNEGLAALAAPGNVFAGSGLPALSRSDDAAAGAERGIVLGAPLARHLGLLRGDTVVLILSEPVKGGLKPRLLRFALAGTFTLNAELDTSLAVIHSSALPPALRARVGRESMRLDLAQPTAADRLARQLAQTRPELQVTSWTRTYGEFFRAVALEKTLMFLVLLLVVAVATFNIVSGQLMVVAEKQGDIAILRTMGARAAIIRRAFTLQGLIIASLGIFAGLGLGVLAAANISAFIGWLGEMTSYRLLQGTYFAQLPTEVRASDLLIIGSLAFLLSLLAAFVPAARAAELNPVEALHAV
jgi:lipoprotein-releasing system permease protein